jgi:hypothetical protein
MGGRFQRNTQANLLSSFRLADRERESLKQELHNLLQADISAVRMELQQGSFAMLSDMITRLGSSDYEIKSLRQDFLYLSQDIAHSRAGQYLAQGDDQAAIAEYGKLLSIAIELGSDYSIRSALESIKQMLERGVRPSASIANKMVENINRVQPSFVLQCERIQELLRGI